MIHQPMIHGISLSLLLLLCGLSLGVQADQVDDYIEAQMREQHIPGLSIAVVKDGQVLKAKGYGLANIELNVPAIAETVYRLASLTKPFTATAIMLLVQDG
ncbi:MAG TPA: serine hydrolase domain-containing protein, partial [Blastocatellia bacterium]|nr:serine hydrolase domain-containing protein [Blastocatellia bacterium]